MYDKRPTYYDGHDDPFDSCGEHESSHYKSLGFDDTIQKKKFEKQRSYVKGSLFLIAFGYLVKLSVEWWPHILRMLNAIVQ